MAARGQRKLPYTTDSRGNIKKESTEQVDSENKEVAPINDGDALSKAITLASEQAMGALEVREALTRIQRHLIARLPRIVAKLVEKAEDGDLLAIKLILDRFIPTRKAVERIEGETMSSGGIRIIVQGTTTINNDVVTEADYEEQGG
jgi:hypothetical protein